MSGEPEELSELMELAEVAEDLLEQERARTALWKAAAKRWRHVQLAEDTWTDPLGKQASTPLYNGPSLVRLDPRCIYCGTTGSGCTGACEP